MFATRQVTFKPPVVQETLTSTITDAGPCFFRCSALFLLVQRQTVEATGHASLPHFARRCPIFSRTLTCDCVKHSKDIESKHQPRTELDFVWPRMNDDNSQAVHSAIDMSGKGGTSESCAFCRAPLDATHMIVERSRQKRDDKAECARQRTEIPFIAELGRLDEAIVNSDCQEHKRFFRLVFEIRGTADSTRDCRLSMCWNPSKGVAELRMMGLRGGTQQGRVICWNSSRSMLNYPAWGDLEMKSSSVSAF